MKIRVIVNPRAGSGKASAVAGAVAAELTQRGADFDLRETRGPGDAGTQVASAYKDGKTLALLVGGDGTVNEAVQAFVDESGQPVAGPELGLISAGTGGDFPRTFGRSDLETAIERILHRPARRIDHGVIRCRSFDGTERIHAFANIASFGITGLVDRTVNRSPKWIGGRAAFLGGTLVAAAKYRCAPLRVFVDDELWLTGPCYTVAAANGQYFGAGMRIAPDADPSDGLLDFIALTDPRARRMLELLPKVFSGAHIDQPGVQVKRGTQLRAELLRDDDPVYVDSDGENPGTLPFEAWIAPGGIMLRI